MGDRSWEKNISRSIMWIVSGVLTAVYLPFLVYAATPENVSYLLLIFGLLYGAPYAINSTYLSESFPAGVRGTAVAVSYNLGRIGSMASPLLIGMNPAYRVVVGSGRQSNRYGDVSTIHQWNSTI